MGVRIDSPIPPVRMEVPRFFTSSAALTRQQLRSPGPESKRNSGTQEETPGGGTWTSTFTGGSSLPDRGPLGRRFTQTRDASPAPTEVSPGRSGAPTAPRPSTWRPRHVRLRPSRGSGRRPGRPSASGPKAWDTCASKDQKVYPSLAGRAGPTLRCTPVTRARAGVHERFTGDGESRHGRY